MYNRKKLDDQDNSKIENIAKLVPNGKKKWVRYDEGAVLYSMGINSFRQLAKDAKAIYRVNRIVLVNTEKVDVGNAVHFINYREAVLEKV